MLALPMELAPTALPPLTYRPRLTWDARAKRAWVTFYNEHAAEQVDLSGDEAAAWSKLEGYAARFALVMHLTRWAAGDATLHDPARVDEASIAAGVVLARWFANEARRVYAILGESDEGRESRRLVEWIERRGGTVTVRDLTRGPREYRGDPERAAKALGELVAAGVGRWEVDAHGPKGGRPADRFRLLSRGGDTGDWRRTSVDPAENRVRVLSPSPPSPAHRRRRHLGGTVNPHPTNSPRCWRPWAGRAELAPHPTDAGRLRHRRPTPDGRAADLLADCYALRRYRGRSCWRAGTPPTPRRAGASWANGGGIADGWGWRRTSDRRRGRWPPGST